MRSVHGRNENNGVYFLNLFNAVQNAKQITVNSIAIRQSIQVGSLLH